MAPRWPRGLFNNERDLLVLQSPNYEKLSRSEVLPGFDHGHLEGDVLHHRRIQQPGLLGSVGHSTSLPTSGFKNTRRRTIIRSLCWLGVFCFTCLNSEPPGGSLTSTMYTWSQHVSWISHALLSSVGFFRLYIYILIKEKLQSLLITVTRLHGDRLPCSVLLLTWCLRHMLHLCLWGCRDDNTH